MPVALELALAHKHAFVVPVEAHNAAFITAYPFGLPEKNGLSLEFLWIGRGASNPAIDHFILEPEATGDETCFLEMLLEVESFHAVKILLVIMEVESELLYDPTRLLAKKPLELPFPLFPFFR